jgi:prepilin signal peptidase PulO-like enzyme (type II secretory pathway)
MDSASLTDFERIFITVTFLVGCLIGPLLLNLIRSYLKSRDPESKEYPRLANYAILFSNGFLYALISYKFLQSTQPEPVSDGNFQIVKFLFYIAPFIKAFILTSFLLILACLNLRTQLLPNKYTFAGIILGLVFSFTTFPENPPEWHLFGISNCYLDFFIGFLGTGIIMYLFAGITQLIFKTSIGGGDVKTTAMIGAFCGINTVLLYLPAFMLWGFIYASAIRFSIKSRLLPTGPIHLIVGITLMMYGKTLILLLIRLFSSK